MATVLRGARVYDGSGFGAPSELALDGGILVAEAPAGADVVDAAGGYVVPGLIDCHVHLYGPETLAALAAHGVTTALDMGTPTPVVAALRGLPGTTDVRSSLMAATSPESAHARRMKDLPGLEDRLVAGAADADGWVRKHVDQGADYLKVIIDLPGFDQETVDALVDAAHRAGRKVVAHVTTSDAFAMAQRAGVDVLTHVPLDRPLDLERTAELAAAGSISVPTLTMMRGTADALHAAGVTGPRYESARDTVRVLHAAGVPVLAGTDANATPAAPASPAFGSSLHDELGLLVEAGLSTHEALAAATSVAADRFGLSDRGRLAVGLRADVVLLDGDPLEDVSATRRIRGVWCAGVRVV